MSLTASLCSWVMLDGQQDFVPLPHERTLYQSPPRTSFALASKSGAPEPTPLDLRSPAGVVYLTNQRVIYLPAQKTDQLQSFYCPVRNLHDSHVSAPFFGPNVWSAIVQPVRNGGIPPTSSKIELNFVFKDGGAFDFHSMFVRLKERLAQALENSTSTDPAAALRTVDLEDLPAYEAPPVPASVAAPSNDDLLQPDSVPPFEPPPSYEETQMGSVAEALEVQEGTQH